jgi:penicillin-binding protein 1A
MDLKLQKVANESVDYGLRAYDKRRGYRGPLSEFETIEEMDDFREEIDTILASRPLTEGKIYKGVITSIDKKAKSLQVDVGTNPGVVRWRDLRWARVYNPTAEPDGVVVDDPLPLFKTGDVIYVKVKKLPADEEAPLQLALEQEPLVEAALLAMEPETGYVRAMVGGSNFSKTQFNRTVQALRQPGSAFKPIIYSAALDQKYTPATIVMDTPIVFDDIINEIKWRPRNYDEQFLGPTTVRKAIAKSRNIVTIKVLKEIGVSRAIEYAHKLGIRSQLADDLSLALGSSALTIEEMTTAFSTFANLGYRPTPIYITKITDKDGNVIEENIPTAEQAMNPETSYMMTNLLQGVIQNGTGRRAKPLGRPAAGKTGTTNNLNDAWFLGYVPDLVAGVWVGYDDEKKLGKHETGSRAAIPIWLKFMKGATKGTPVKNFEVPEGVEFAKIDSDTGLLALPESENVIFEVFKSGTAPTEVSTPSAAPGATDFFILEAGGVPPEELAPVMPTVVLDDLADPEDVDAGPVYDQNPELMVPVD